MTVFNNHNQPFAIKRTSLLCLTLCFLFLTSCYQEEPHLSLIKKEYVREAQLKTNGDTLYVRDKDYTDAIYHLLTTMHTKVGESYYPEPRWWVDEWDEIILVGFQEGIGNIYSQMYIFCQDGRYYVEQQYSGLFEITQEQYDAAMSILRGKAYKYPIATFDGRAETESVALPMTDETEEEIQS